MPTNGKIRIGILGAADIAVRRFLPALVQNENFEFAGVATAGEDERNKSSVKGRKTGSHKAEEIVTKFGGKVYSSYMSLIEDNEVDALYIPLPPSLHYAWGLEAIKNHKNIYMEKPFTTCYEDTKKLLTLAEEMGVRIYENYVFDAHPQFEIAKNIIKEKQIGDVRQIRCSFGFPYRGEQDFRYSAELGGGAILDAGGYLIRCLNLLLDEDIVVRNCQLRKDKNHDIDIYGTALVTSEKGKIGILSFGMDQQYKCELEIWGEKGIATFNRMYTPGPEFKPSVVIVKGFDTEEVIIDAVDTFAEGIKRFARILMNEEEAEQERKAILAQSELVQKLIEEGTYE